MQRRQENFFFVRLALPNQSWSCVIWTGVGTRSRQTNTKCSDFSSWQHTYCENRHSLDVCRPHGTCVWYIEVVRSRWEDPLACRAWCHQSLISSA